MRQKKSKLDSTNAEALSLVRTDPQRATKLADWAFQEAQSIRYLKGQADALRVIAIAQSDSDSTISQEQALRAIDIYRQLGDEHSESSLLIFLAKFIQNSGWLNRAHFVLAEAYEKAVNSGNLRIQAAALFNLGANAEDRGDYSDALDYFVRAREAGKLCENEQIYWRALSAEQEMHYHLKDGLFDCDQVLEALKALSVDGREDSLIELFMFLSKVARDEKDPVRASRYLKQSFQLARKVQSEEVKAEILYQFGLHRFADGRYDSAKKLFMAALFAAQSLGLRALELSCTKQMAETLFKIGDASDAYATLGKYVSLKEELNELETERHFEEMKTMQQVQLVEEESKVLRKRNTELGVVNERLEAALAETQKLQKELQRLVTIDELTGALNRREILSRGNEIVSRFHSQGRPGAVMIVDIDHFKSINDNFGHATGDEILRRFTKSCQRVLRPTDSFGRLGGEEFCILLDRTHSDVALKVAERVLKSIRATRVDDLMGDRILTASIGLVEVDAGHDSIELALHDADTSLYQAKGTGRDKICVAGVKKNKAA